MIPAAFVTLAALPLLPGGKVDRGALPAPESRRAADSHEAPKTPVEQLVAGIWGELLGVERIARTDHFFDLGGHSLLATRVLSRLRDTFEVEVELRRTDHIVQLADQIPLGLLGLLQAGRHLGVVRQVTLL